MWLRTGDLSVPRLLIMSLCSLSYCLIAYESGITHAAQSRRAGSGRHRLLVAIEKVGQAVELVVIGCGSILD